MRYMITGYMVALLLLVYASCNTTNTIRRIEEPPSLLCVNTYHIPDDYISPFEVKWRRSSYNEMLYGAFAE